jgi:DinB superfamily
MPAKKTARAKKTSLQKISRKTSQKTSQKTMTDANRDTKANDGAGQEASHDKALRGHLLYLLHGGGAHAKFDAAVKDLPAELRGKLPEGAEHTAWETLEHMRITQWDILEFSRNPDHISPDWPTEYWPSTQTPPDADAWDQTVKAIEDDMNAMCALVEDKSTDLYARIAHGDGQTILREALLMADHNAYHVGQLVLTRRLLGAWPSA